MNKNLRDRLQATADEVVRILAVKDDQYGSSWKSHGGFSAFFNLDRKWSRVENMAQAQKYDLFAAMLINPDGADALKDLIGYALLTLSETYEPPKMRVEPWSRECDEELDEDAAHVIETEEMMKFIDEMKPGPDYTNQDREV